MIAKPLPRGLRIPLAVALVGTVVATCARGEAAEPPPAAPREAPLLDKAKAQAPARSLVSIDDVGVATAFLAHDAARLITGETLYIDGGYHIID